MARKIGLNPALGAAFTRCPQQSFSQHLAAASIIAYRKGSNIVNSTLDTIERPGREVTKPVLDISVANWLTLHGFDFEAVRAQHRGAFIWYWRITRHSDPHRPRRAVDVPLHCSDLRHMEIRVGRMWPDVI